MRSILKKIVFLLLTAMLMFTCQYEPDIHSGGVDFNKDKEIEEAKRWYDATRPEEVSFRSSNSVENASSIEVKPDWEQAYVRANKKEKTVETNLFMKGEIYFVQPENKQKFEETHDERYMRSHTRLVVKTELSSGAKDAFLMTIIPSVEYLELTDFKAFDNNSYIGRDKQFTGRILYHNLEGEFVNGWVYKNGRITHSLKRVQPNEDPVISLKSSGSSDCQEVEQWGWTRTCTDWYQYTNIDSTPVYTGTTCTDWKYEFIGTEQQCTSGDGGNGEDGGDIDGEEDDYSGGTGGGGGGGYVPQPISLSPELQQILKGISMTDTQKSKLNQALSEFIHEGCMQVALYNTLVDNRVYLDFGMRTSGTSASYDPISKGITFSSTADITSASLKEELFHAWQDAYYPGGISQYTEVGKVNIEFEAKFYQDIIGAPNGLCCITFGVNLPDNLYQEYYAWIESIRLSEKLSFSNSDYVRWLNIFSEYDLYYTSPINSSLSIPYALQELISNSNCF